MTELPRSARRLARPHDVSVLCVDDEPVTLRLIERLLHGMGCSVTAVGSPVDGIARFDDARYDLVITDIRMPGGMDGHAFLAAIRERDQQVPVVVVTGHATIDNAIRALREGASGMLIKPFTGSEFATEVGSALERARVRHDALQYRFITPVLDGVALALSAAIEARDLETGAHCRQLGVLSERVAMLLGLGEQERTTIRIGGFLHDVGKIAIADRILLKPGKLSDEEYREMQRHSELGAGIVSTHAAMGGIASIVRHHHERFDGAGYPDRMRGTDIPLGARIVSVADAYSAMTTDRVYRAARSEDEAWDELRLHAGRQFDPAIVELFEAAVRLDEMASAAAATEAAPAGHRVQAPDDVSRSHDRGASARPAP